MAENKKPSESDQPVIAVFGSSSAVSGEASYEEAVLVGAKLAELGYSIVTGGYGGLMEAVSRGSAVRGAKRIIGVTCHIWRSKPNAHVTEIVDTYDIFQRVQRLIEIGQAGFVVLAGGTGTLLELAAAWEVIFKKMAPPRPIVCVGKLWRPVLTPVLTIQPEAERVIHFIERPSELDRHFSAVQCRPD